MNNNDGGDNNCDNYNITKTKQVVVLKQNRGKKIENKFTDERMSVDMGGFLFIFFHVLEYFVYPIF